MILPKYLKSIAFSHVFYYVGYPLCINHFAVYDMQKLLNLHLVGFSYALTIATLLSFLPITKLSLALTTYQPERSDPILEPWRWQSYPQLEGRIVHCVTEAADSSLWFGLEDGVARYDGLNWSFSPTEDGIVGKQTTAICGAKDGSIYVGTEIGLNRYYKKRWTLVFPVMCFP